MDTTAKIKAGAALKLGTRGSALALAQTNAVIAALAAQGVVGEAVVFSTRGDRDLSRPLHELGDKGLFTQELEAALTCGAIDAAVHSAKDLSAFDDPDLPLVAALEREATGDILVGARLSELAAGARIGTSSLRRSAQMRALRPDVQTVSVRGNINTRLTKLADGQIDALILAEAGLNRLNLLAGLTAERLPFLPAPAQGIIAIQAVQPLPIWTALTHGPTWAALHTERGFVRGLGAHCRLPVAVQLGEQLGESLGKPLGKPLGKQSVIEAWRLDGTKQSLAGPVTTPAEAEALGAALLAALSPGYFEA